MFGWLKKKEENSQEQLRNVALTYQGLESGLKGIESHWLVGNQKQGDELFDAVFAAGMHNFFLGGNRPDVVRIAQFEGIKALIKFLQKHNKQIQLNKLVKAIPAHRNEFTPDQLIYLMEALRVMTETVQSTEGNVDQRLIYFICQKCGYPNLISTAPCLCCGFSATNELMYRRALLLCSNMLQVPMLLGIATELMQSSPLKRIEEVWKHGNVDQVALQKTQGYNDQLKKLLAISIENSETFSGPLKFQSKCTSCGKVQDIEIQCTLQNCRSCNSQLAVPYFRRLKATLHETLIWMIFYADHRESHTNSNFFGSFILITDYALRRDTPPTKAQGQNLIDRFSTICPQTYFDGKLQVTLTNGRVTGTIKSVVSALQQESIDSHLLALNSLFDMLRSDELQA